MSHILSRKTSMYIAKVNYNYTNVANAIRNFCMQELAPCVEINCAMLVYGLPNKLLSATRMGHICLKSET